MPRPDLSRLNPFYHNYIRQVEADDLSIALAKYNPATISFFENIPADKYEYRYAEGKWTPKEILQHIIDAERIFSYRALCFARKDTTPLPGFDENLYADNSNANSREWESLLNEFKSVRSSSTFLFQSFNEDQLDASGLANNSPAYVSGIGFLLIGHCQHHVNILKERYLNA